MKNKKIDWYQIPAAICLLVILVMNFTPLPGLFIEFIENSIIHRPSVDRAWLIKDIRQQSALVLGFVACFLTYMTRKKDYGKFFSSFIIYMFIVSNFSIWTSDISKFTGYRSTWNYEDFLVSAHTGYGTFYGTNYPPLAILFYKLLHIPMSGIDFEQREYFAEYILFMYILVTGIFMFVMFQKYYCKNAAFDINRGAKGAGVMFLTGPVLFAMERGNIIVLALLFTLGFLLTYDASDVKKRHSSSLLLALAANMKFYPAVFGLIYVKRKQWKEALWAAFYGIVLFAFLIPFQNSTLSVMAAESVATESMAVESMVSENMAVESMTAESMATLDPSVDLAVVETMSPISGVLNGINILTSVISEDVGGLSLKSIIQTVFALFKLDMNGLAFKIVFIIALIACIVLSIYCFFRTKRLDHELAMLSFLCILVPSVSAWYSILFLILPLIVFLRDINKLNKNIFTDIEIALYAISFIYAEFNGLYVGPGYNWYTVLLYLVIVIQILSETGKVGGQK